jgi:hypothetical protein
MNICGERQDVSRVTVHCCSSFSREFEELLSRGKGQGWPAPTGFHEKDTYGKGIPKNSLDLP